MAIWFLIFFVLGMLLIVPHAIYVNYFTGRSTYSQHFNSPSSNIRLDPWHLAPNMNDMRLILDVGMPTEGTGYGFNVIINGPSFTAQKTIKKSRKNPNRVQPDGKHFFNIPSLVREGEYFIEFVFDDFKSSFRKPTYIAVQLKQNVGQLNKFLVYSGLLLIAASIVCFILGKLKSI